MAHAYGLDAAGEQQLERAVRVRDVAARHAEDVDAKGRFPSESLAAAAKEDLLGLCVAKEHGGAGERPRTFAAVVEELATACGSTAMVYVMHVSAAQAIAASRTLEGKDALLREIAAGRHLTTLAFSEKGSRSQFWAPVSTLSEDGGGYVTSAQKSWVTSAAHADSYVASAQAPKASSPLESTLYLVRKGARGMRVTGPFQGLGLRGNDSSPVSMERVGVPRGDLVSAPGAGAQAMLEVVLPWFNVGTAAMANGLSRAAVDATAKHLQGSAFAHTASALRDLPTLRALRARLARMSILTEQARGMLARTVASMEAPSADTVPLVLGTRAASLEAALTVTDLAMKACGGAAFSKQVPVERVFRDARAGWVMAPTVDHLEEFLGRLLVGLPLF
jgi:alkylation response protein AidB-like acyl-CoA dehydrogenase